MLEKSMAKLDSLSPELHHLAEEMAVASLVSGLSEDLISSQRSAAIVLDHKEAETEEWLRALAGSVASIGAIQKLGYKLQSPSNFNSSASSGQRTIHGGSHE